MELLNESHFEFAPIVGKVSPPQDSLTLIVKGTFRLSPGETTTLVDEQLLPTGDELYEDDDEGQGSCRYDSDFAYFKPYTDLLLVGNCHPPAGRQSRAIMPGYLPGRQLCQTTCCIRQSILGWNHEDPVGS